MKRFDIKTYEVIDDVNQLGTKLNMDNTNILLGTYSTSDWIIATVKQKIFAQGRNVIATQDKWLAPTLKLSEWIQSLNGCKYVFDTVNDVMVYQANGPKLNVDESGIAKISLKNGKIDASFFGSPEWCKHWENLLDSVASRAGAMIEWVYGQHGEQMSLPLNFRPAINAAYPWLNMSVNDYIDDYLNSEASVLLLIGPPGTGKTTFIKNLIHRSKRNAKVTYDDRTMSTDSFFAEFMEEDAAFLIMEDADAFLKKRTDGNTMMHKFLNVSDGLISAVDKKLVFSTNLPSINDIDEALTRPGRCFDTITFRDLSRQEAQAVVDEAGAGHVPDGKDRMFLAELFSSQPQASTNKKRRSSMGFY